MTKYTLCDKCGKQLTGNGFSIFEWDVCHNCLQKLQNAVEKWMNNRPKEA